MPPDTQTLITDILTQVGLDLAALGPLISQAHKYDKPWLLLQFTRTGALHLFNSLKYSEYIQDPNAVGEGYLTKDIKPKPAGDFKDVLDIDLAAIQDAFPDGEIISVYLEKWTPGNPAGVHVIVGTHLDQRILDELAYEHGVDTSAPDLDSLENAINRVAKALEHGAYDEHIKRILLRQRQIVVSVNALKIVGSRDFSDAKLARELSPYIDRLQSFVRKASITYQHTSDGIEIEVTLTIPK